MDDILISFIIPIYNGEKYIDRIVNSILKEKCNNIEIILLNDGSKDNSKKILKKYEKNNLIKIINKENTGVSDTRNIGIREAQGKYILFADCDDYYMKGFLKRLISTLRNKSIDLLVFSAYEEEKNLNLKKIFMQENKTIDVSTNCGLNGYINGDFTLKYGNCIWNKVYKVSIIKKYNIKFKTDQKIAEDMLFNIEYMEYIKKICSVDESLYVYCYNENSVTRKYRNNFLDEYLKIGNNIKSIAEKVKYNNYNFLISNFYLQSTGFIMYNEILSNNKRNSIKKLKKYFTNPIFTRALKKTKISELSLKNILKYIMIKVRLYTLVYNIIFIRERKRNNV